MLDRRHNTKGENNEIQSMAKRHKLFWQGAWEPPPETDKRITSEYSKSSRRHRNDEPATLTETHAIHELGALYPHEARTPATQQPPPTKTQCEAKFGAMLKNTTIAESSKTL